jgi:hypothetical protein
VVRQAVHHPQQEAIMFHVLDHADLVYTGELSQATQFIIDHYGKKLDEAIRSGIRIAYTDAFHGLSEARQVLSGAAADGKSC